MRIPRCPFPVSLKDTNGGPVRPGSVEPNGSPILPYGFVLVAVPFGTRPRRRPRMTPLFRCEAASVGTNALSRRLSREHRVVDGRDLDLKKTRFFRI